MIVLDAATSTIVVDTTTNGTSFTANLLANKQYRWLVDACNSNGCSSYTTPLSSLGSTGWICGDHVQLYSTSPSGSLSLSGSVSGPANLALTGVSVNLNGAVSATTHSTSSGQYSFPNLQNGSYTITPSQAGYLFDPTSTNKTLSGAPITGLDFKACQTGQNLKLNLTDQNNMKLSTTDASITIDGASVSHGKDANGHFTIDGLSCGKHNITVNRAGGAVYETAFLSRES